MSSVEWENLLQETKEITISVFCYHEIIIAKKGEDLNTSKTWYKYRDS